MSYVVYKFEFKVDGRLNATRLVTFKSYQYTTVFVDHCRRAWDWACKKPGRHVLAVGPDNSSSLVCPDLIDAVIRRMGIRELGVSSDTPSDAQWQLLLEALPTQHEAHVVDNGWHSTDDWDCGCHYAQSHCGDEDYIRLCDAHATDVYRSFFQ